MITSRTHLGWKGLEGRGSGLNRVKNLIRRNPQSPKQKVCVFYLDLVIRGDKILEMLSKPHSYFYFLFSMCGCLENTPCKFYDGKEGE